MNPVPAAPPCRYQMGGTLSASTQEELRRDKERFKQWLATPPDLKVNGSLQMFTSLSCSDSLKVHLARRREEGGSGGPDIIKALAEKLGGLSPSFSGAGRLGTLALAIYIDMLSDTPPAQSTTDALQEALAEQVSEVWDLVDETLKRCVMNVQNKRQLASDIQRLEEKLSMALTRLRNSVLRDSHVSSQALKVWVNGAAFHVQMLIHQVRLGGARTCEHVERLISVYKSDLETLFRSHEQMIKSKCTSQSLSLGVGSYIRYLVDEESRQNNMCYFGNYHGYLQLYYQHQYGRQEEEIQRHFSGVQQDLQQLVGQKGHLSLQ